MKCLVAIRIRGRSINVERASSGEVIVDQMYVTMRAVECLRMVAQEFALFRSRDTRCQQPVKDADVGNEL